MDDKNAARHIAAIFGRSCREPSNDPGLDPALDSAAEVIACIRAEARAEAPKEAKRKALAWWFDPNTPNTPEAMGAAILADEPKFEEHELYVYDDAKPLPKE